MITSLSSILFTNPWILSALTGLPLIWFILRITPPTPKRIIFPPSRFLAGLIPESPTTAKTPWWILLLRLTITALVILAIAGPVLHPQTGLTGKGALYLIVDNDWSSAPTWDKQIKKAGSLITQAGRQSREIYITTTAADASQDTAATYGPLSETEAYPVLRGLMPQPWPASYSAVQKTVEQTVDKSGIKDSTFAVLSAGLVSKDLDSLLNSLTQYGDIHLYRHLAEDTALLLRASQKTTAKPAVLVENPEGQTRIGPASISILSANGQTLDTQNITFDDGQNVRRIEFDIPDSLRGRMTQIRINGQYGAGGVLLLDNNFKRRQAGIAAPDNSEESIPFVEAQYYLQKALEPLAYTKTGAIMSLIKDNVDVIYLPDVAGMPTSDMNALNDWVSSGGVLVRFAGPNMAQSSNNMLLPAPLLKGSRSLEGTLTWETPAKLAPFPQDSPFFDIPVSDEITVNRQLLTRQNENDTVMSWATLTDGTPLITAAKHNNGLLVFVHTSATADWSDIVISGTFVQILKRIMALSPGKINEAAEGGTLQPLLYLDGSGHLKQPAPFIQPIDISADTNQSLFIDSAHPPGFYGRAGYETALNLGDILPRLRALNDIPMAIKTHNYTGTGEKKLTPYLLLAAMTLFFIDWMVMISMGKGLRSLRRNLVKPAPWSALIIALIICASSTASAQSANNTAHMKYANNLYLAYINTGNARIDALTHKGLETLADVLKTRTSVEPEGIIALNAEKDQMAFFPLIYWAIAPQEKPLSDQAIRNLQNYMDHGGTIVIDTRSPASTSHNIENSNQIILRRIMGAMNIPPLKPMENDHVLGRSFYLLKSFPGVYDGGTIWIEDGKSVGRDGVSPIIIGSNDWAGAWAASANQRQMTGNNRQQELALRFGVNLVMYALTGNYKADQVHLPFILERLDQ